LPVGIPLAHRRAIHPSTEGHVVIRDEQVDELEGELLAYLREHPEAGDTADGITQWWIHRQRLAVIRVAVEAALERLVDAGHLVRRTTASGQVVYSAAASADEG
jgi:hypothetical protein